MRSLFQSFTAEFWFLANDPKQYCQARFSHDKETGSVTIENVIWAVAVIAIATIVIVAITNYVQKKAAEIQ